jgi:riboflavin kinase / FMN adenylyltransferase
MKLFRGMHNLNPYTSGCVATIGNFDGVHVGHQAIIEQLHATARSLGLPAVVIVFEPQPREFFDAEGAPPRLMRFSEKLEALQALQIDCVVCLQFNQRFRSLTAQEFIEKVLIKGLHVRHLVVGDDFRFGCDRSGDFKLLQEFGELCDFSVNHTSTLEVAGERVSSTLIRSLLTQGQFEHAALLLGHPYTVTGRVMHGKKLGRQLGVPTANINPGRRKPVLNGVFAVQATIGRNRNSDGKNYTLPGVANIGLRPSVEKKTGKPVLEVHLLDFDSDLYGQRVTVRFLKKIRDERKFDGLDELQQQIHADIKDVEDYFLNSAVTRLGN